MKIIVFISELATDIQSQWLIHLKKQLINETILLPNEVTVSQAQQIDIAIVANPNPKVLARFPNLVWIQSLWAGVENLVAQSNDKPVKLVKLDDPHLAKTMAESVLAWTLYLHRNMPEYAQQQLNKHWQQLPSIAPEELRVSVLGTGALGLAALDMLKKFNYQVSCWSKTSKQLNGVTNYIGSDGLKTMLGKTDVLINLLPLTPSTRYLLNQELLSQLPNGAKLINFSRGAVIDTQALLKLLQSRHIAHAVLDVFEHEPLPTNDPLWCNPNVTVLPHISAPTNMFTAVKVVAKNITRYRENNVMPNAIDVNKGY